ncbi:MAG: hypothetical protein FJZ01_26635 [Candidatus Sericytochromatia bacterium]|nr:hypothetical protein [Candidatus Tanganyikabacteria bacterium]
MGSTVSVAVQGSGALRRTGTVDISGIALVEPRKIEKIEFESYLGVDDGTEVANGRQLLEVTAEIAPRIEICVDRVTMRHILLEQVDRAYMAAERGCGDQQYLEAAIAAADFLRAEFPDDPRVKSLSHLVVDIAVWMGWDARDASPAVRRGVKAAAEYTAAHPEPNVYLTVEQPRQALACEGAPVRFTFTWPWWLPRWLRDFAALWLWDALIDTVVVGRRRIHPCDHKARAEGLLLQLSSQ